MYYTVPRSSSSTARYCVIHRSYVSYCTVPLGTVRYCAVRRSNASYYTVPVSSATYCAVRRKTAADPCCLSACTARIVNAA